MSKINLRQPSAIIPTEQAELTFNLLAALPGRASSMHTQRAYFRWIDQYLVDIAGLNATDGAARVHRMSMLSVKMLQNSLSAQQLRAWLGMLVRSGNGKQGINQARAALVTLASLLAESELLDDYTSAAMGNVRPPKAEDGQRQGRWLSTGQIKLLIAASQQIANSENQALRNHVITAVLCTMALRREELSSARWGDLALQNDRVILRVHGKGRKMANIDVPRPVMSLLNRWRSAVTACKSPPVPESPLVRRIYKGGGISPRPITADGIWWLIGDAAEAAGLGNVAPHDLRRSVAGALHEAGTPIEKISLLLRHSNVAVTERYLSRLPQRNEGAVLMSDMLGLDFSDEPDWVE
jgi:integrase